MREGKLIKNVRGEWMSYLAEPQKDYTYRTKVPYTKSLGDFYSQKDYTYTTKVPYTRSLGDFYAHCKCM